MAKVEEYIRLREQHMSYAAIGKRYGITRQAVYDEIRRHRARSDIHVKEQTVAFPGLRAWMNAHHVFVSELEQDTGFCLRRALSSGRIGNEKINAILDRTGLTYEQAFGEACGPDA